MYARWWCRRDLRAQVGLPLGSHLLQRDDNPGYHHRDEPDEIHVSHQPRVACCASEENLTQHFPCQRETEQNS